MNIIKIPSETTAIQRALKQCNEQYMLYLHTDVTHACVGWLMLVAMAILKQIANKKHRHIIFATSSLVHMTQSVTLRLNHVN